MRNTKIILSLFVSFIFIQIILNNSISITRADSDIPSSYYQELDLNDIYKYEVHQFGGAVGWYNFTPWPGDSFEGKWNTSIGGQIIINFSGFHDKDPNDWGNVFDDPIPWFDINILENRSGVLKTNFTLNNRSNSEIARALILGYNSFQPGFLIPSNNLTRVKELAINQSDPGGLWDIVGKLNVKETSELLYISFDQVEGAQKTYLVYDRSTGLLVWAKSSIGGYLLEIESLDFEFDFSLPQKDNNLMDFLPYLIIILVSAALIASSLIIAKVNPNFKKFNKYVLVAIIGIASITSFLIFTSSLGTTEVNKAQEEVNNITLIIDYGNGTLKTQENFELINYNTTVFDALSRWCEVEYHDYGDMGILIESIDGISGNWLYYVNDEYISLSSDKYNLKNGDTIEWVIS